MLTFRGKHQFAVTGSFDYTRRNKAWKMNLSMTGFDSVHWELVLHFLCSDPAHLDDPRTSTSSQTRPIRLFLCWVIASAHLAENLLPFLKKIWGIFSSKKAELNFSHSLVNKQGKEGRGRGTHGVMGNSRREEGSFITDSSPLQMLRYHQWRLAGTRLWQ